MNLEDRIRKLEAQSRIVAAELTQHQDINRRMLGMIAHNMLAVVRLELATWSDQVTNVALNIKRDVTGSGDAKLVINIAATAAMLAGNILTAGGMSALGAVLVGVSGVLTAANEEDPVALLSASATLGLASSRQAQSDPEKFGRANYTAKTDAEEDQEVKEGQEDKSLEVAEEGARQAKKVYDYIRKKRKETEEGGYKVKRKTTVWIPHGAGGTNAITYDVQKAIVEGYESSMETLAAEISAFASTGKISPASLLDKLSVFEGKKSAGAGDSMTQLHPLTKHVLELAMSQLAATGGAKYPQTSGNKLTRGSKTTKAKAQVKAGYRLMAEEIKAGKISSAKILLDQIKSRS